MVVSAGKIGMQLVIAPSALIEMINAVVADLTVERNGK
jgi:prolyl-tRNA editing enzyme YbaK/EbsC (Cys-tRNA(Pro) deacylase)